MNMIRHDRDQERVSARLREVLKALSRVEDPDEEERLLNEHLYLRGLLAGLKTCAEQSE